MLEKSRAPPLACLAPIGQTGVSLLLLVFLNALSAPSGRAWCYGRQSPLRSLSAERSNRLIVKEKCRAKQKQKKILLLYFFHPDIYLTVCELECLIHFNDHVVEKKNVSVLDNLKSKPKENRSDTIIPMKVHQNQLKSFTSLQVKNQMLNIISDFLRCLYRIYFEK